MDELFALDIETTGLDPRKDRIIGIGIYNPRNHKFFDSVADFATWYRNCVHTPLFIAHRGAFDVNFIRNVGLDIRDSWVLDTRSIASILVPRPDKLGLEFLAEKYLGQTPYKLDRTNMASYSRDEVASYCLKDCELTYQLYQLFRQKLDAKSWDFVQTWLMPATKFCGDMEYDGVYVDRKGLELYNNEMVAKRDQLRSELQERAKTALVAYHAKQVKEVTATYKELYETAKEKTKDKEKCLRRYSLLEAAAISKLEPFNWNSSEQLKWLLKDYLGLDIFNVREAKETTNEAKLAELSHQHEIPKILLEYREHEKLVSTCIPALLEHADANSFVHTSYHIGGTRTGRLSSSSPNLQQIPRGRLRSYIQAAPSLVGGGPRSLVTIDYAQIEVRIIAEIAKEKELIHAFKEEIDPYSVIAQKLLKINCPVKDIKAKFKKERDVSKTAGLSILYGTGAAKLQEVLRKELGRDYKISECKNFIEDYRNSLPGVKAFKQHLEQALANGKIYYNLLGRPFSIEHNEDIYMNGLNTLVQGSASDMVIWSQTEFVLPELKKLGVEFKHRMLIHDEVVIELNTDEAELLIQEVIEPCMTTKVMESLGMEVPLKVEYVIDRAWEKP